MKVSDIPKSGKCGNTVWQRARYGQICYPVFVPYNPRTPAQVAVRGNFRAVSARWRMLTQEQRDVWIAVARTKWSKPRVGTGRLTGCQFFVKINVPLADQGKPQVDLPPGYARSSQSSFRADLCILHSSFCLQYLLAGMAVSKQDTRTARILLRYRGSTVVPLYPHRSTTLAGRCVRSCAQARLRLRCRPRPARCRPPFSPLDGCPLRVPQAGVEAGAPVPSE